jgi:hypothetical protein
VKAGVCVALRKIVQTPAHFYTVLRGDASFPEKYNLKVLSNEMHLAKSGLIRKLFIKERGPEVFRKLFQPFKDSAPSRTAVGY